MTRSCDGKVAIVTGAAGGIGRAIAVSLAEAGADVCVGGKQLALEEETASHIRRASGRALAVQVDVTDRHSVEQMVDATIREFGRLDVLVNNAAVGNRDSLLEVTEAAFDRVMATNVKGPLLCARAAVPHMRASGGGSIVNVVSTSSELARPNLAVYGTSKGALKMLTKGMAVEWAQWNIRVNGICPHTVPTEMNQAYLSQLGVVEGQLRRIPLGRLGRPEDCAGAVVFLASEISSWMTGAMLWLDGGFLSLG